MRRAATDRLIVADGFSCREQIAQTTTRRALHTAQVLKMGLDMAHNGTLPPGAYPETRYVTEEDRTGNRTAVAVLTAACSAEAGPSKRTVRVAARVRRERIMGT